MILYLLTISCQQKKAFVQQSDLDEVLLWLKMNEDTFHVYKQSYERSGKYLQLHFHAIVGIRTTFRWRPYTQYGDTEVMALTFRVHWSRVTDYPGAVLYVYKDTKNNSVVQQQIFIQNLYKYHYFNMDTQEFERIETLSA